MFWLKERLEFLLWNDVLTIHDFYNSKSCNFLILNLAQKLFLISFLSRNTLLQENSTKILIHEHIISLFLEILCKTKEAFLLKVHLSK